MQAVRLTALSIQQPGRTEQIPRPPYAFSSLLMLF